MLNHMTGHNLVVVIGLTGQLGVGLATPQMIHFLNGMAGLVSVKLFKKFFPGFAIHNFHAVTPRLGQNRVGAGANLKAHPIGVDPGQNLFPSCHLAVPIKVYLLPTLIQEVSKRQSGNKKAPGFVARSLFEYAEKHASRRNKQASRKLRVQHKQAVRLAEDSIDHLVYRR